MVGFFFVTFCIERNRLRGLFYISWLN
uniref:Uncharacterized protein n=1 Tax=Arundo donax TaxID=35708 RepID=A0A0A8YI76_ARUDO